MIEFDPRYGVTKFIGIIHNNCGTRFLVFETGDPKFYLFNILLPFANCIICSTISFAVRKGTLRDDVRTNLARGFGMQDISTDLVKPK